MIARLIGALLCLVVAAGCTTSDAEPPEPLVSTTCADLVVLGIRGNNQAGDLNQGVGKEVLRTVTDLARRVQSRSGASVRLEAVDYDATGTATATAYFDHVTAGARRAGRQVDALVARCPDSRIAVVGFSQGAQVTHELVEHVSKTLARRIALIGMIADPRRNPADPIRHWSYANTPVPRPGLLGPGPAVDADVRAAAISFCHDADEVCNGRGVRGERTSAAHRFFYERPATVQVTAAQLDDVLRANGV